MILGLFVPLGLAGAVALLLAGRALARRASEGRFGALVAVDVGGGRTYRAPRFALAGRPDAVRRRPDGALVPIELKRRPAPRAGPFYSHQVQLWAYCLLLEEATGRAPPFGVLRYADREFVLPWNARSREELLTVRARLEAPYAGEADPSPSKCARCPWREVCDASLAP